MFSCGVENVSGWMALQQFFESVLTFSYKKRAASDPHIFEQIPLRLRNIACRHGDDVDKGASARRPVLLAEVERLFLDQLSQRIACGHFRLKVREQ